MDCPIIERAFIELSFTQLLVFIGALLRVPQKEYDGKGIVMALVGMLVALSVLWLWELGYWITFCLSFLARPLYDEWMDRKERKKRMEAEKKPLLI